MIMKATQDLKQKASNIDLLIVLHVFLPFIIQQDFCHFFFQQIDLLKQSGVALAMQIMCMEKEEVMKLERNDIT